MAAMLVIRVGEWEVYDPSGFDVDFETPFVGEGLDDHGPAPGLKGQAQATGYVALLGRDLIVGGVVSLADIRLDYLAHMVLEPE